MSHSFNRRTAIVSLAAAATSAFAETPLACNLKALSADERKQHKDRTTRLFTAASITPSDSGYEVKMAAPLWGEAAAWVELERKCCPFLRFVLESAAEVGTVSLRMSGRAGVKEFLAEELNLKK